MSLSRELARKSYLDNYDLIIGNWKANRQAIEWASPIHRLGGAAAGRPAVVVGAGPSLDAELPRLLAWRETYFLVACDRAVKPLLAAAIIPDVIVTVEMSPLGARKMEGLDPRVLARIPLVFDPVCCPKTIEGYPGRLFTFNRPDVVKGKGNLPQGGSVACDAVGVALVSLAPSIALVGVDLVYDGPRTHAKGVVEIPLAIDPKVTVKTVQGVQAPTDVNFLASIEDLARIRDGARDVEMIQTSPVGGVIPGWDQMPLARFFLNNVEVP